MLTVTAASGFGSGGGAVVPATISQTAHAGTGTNNTTTTFSGLSLGAADAGRIMVCGVAGGQPGTVETVDIVTIGGVTATEQVVSTGTNRPCGIWTAAVPSGTTGDVVVTFSTSMSFCHVALWRMLEGDATATDTDAANGKVDGTLTIKGGGVAVGFGQNDNTTVTACSGLTFGDNVSAERETGTSAAAFAANQTELSIDFTPADTPGNTSCAFAAFF